MNEFVTWMVAAMIAHAPQSPKMETAAETRARYESIAKDVVHVAFDPEESPLYSGQDGRKKTALTILAVAIAESGLRKDIDLGKTRGDGGKSWCLMQRNLGKKKSPEGWTGRDLVSDRKKCLRSAYRVMQKSISKCAKRDAGLSFTMYVSGRCTAGQTPSRVRVRLAKKLIKDAPPIKDRDVTDDLRSM